jgi:hypothetical protein
VLDRSTLDRLRSVTPGDGYVVSVYLGHGPDLDELRSMPARLKTLLGEVRAAAEADHGSVGKALLHDLAEVQSMASELGDDLGRGTALFVSGHHGLREHIVLPIPVRDRIVIDPAPYVGPLQAMLDHFHHYAAAVVDRRGASLYRFHMGELQSWEEIAADEPIRKDNYGGFAGYSEQHVRAHAEEVAKRLYRTVAERIADLYRTGAFDLLAIGGNPTNTASLVGEIPGDVTEVLAGTFTLDTHTATPSEVRDHCRAIAAEYDRRADERDVAGLLDVALAGGRAAVGLDPVLVAVNRGAIARLLVAADVSEPGVACVACGALDRKADQCELCGGAMRPIADIVDGVAERARATGAAVRYVLGDSPLNEYAVGAVLRYVV